ncbi:hypothetical protein GF376_04035 [Candidatus Peregrinibacteria bacterium]|nr:hypothetical protein [Candidatus Peregrinibacteria bacterium]
MENVNYIESIDSEKEGTNQLKLRESEFPVNNIRNNIGSLVAGAALGAMVAFVYQSEGNDNNLNQQESFADLSNDEKNEIDLPEYSSNKTSTLRINVDGKKLLLLISDYEKAGNFSLAENLRKARHNASVLVKCPKEETLHDKELALRMILALDLIRLIKEQNPTDPITKSYVLRHQHYLQELLDTKLRLKEVPGDIMILVNALEIANMDSCD